MNSDELKILKVTPGKLSRLTSTDFKAPGFYPARKPIVSGPSVPLFTDFTLHVKHIKLSKTCRNHINSKLRGTKFLKLQWNFYEFDHFIKSPEALSGSAKLRLDFTAQYKFDVNEDFIAQHTKNPIKFHLFAMNDKHELEISKADIFVGNILEVANKKVIERVEFCNESIDVGAACIAYLELWYKFSCNKKNLKDAYGNTDVNRDADLRGSRLYGLRESVVKPYDAVQITNSEVDQFADNLLLVLNRNKVLKTSQEEIYDTLGERVRWLRYEANWKQTLQEHAILHGKDPEKVVWRQWREEDTSNVKLRTYDNLKPTEYKPEFAITIEKIYFLEGSAPLRKESIQRIYVEYSFLGSEGQEMETPFSLQKGTMDGPTVFNFTKTYGINISKNYDNCKRLAELIKHNKQIKFVVITEPKESLENPIQTCEEIGLAEVPLDEIVQLEQNEDTYEYEILDSYNSIAVVGYIRVKFEGILAVRKMALTLMAPKDYKLFM